MIERAGRGVWDPCLPLRPTAATQESIVIHQAHPAPTPLSSWGLPSLASMPCPRWGGVTLPLTDGGNLRAWEPAEGHATGDQSRIVF